MNNIVSVGLDTHKNSISICATRPYYGPGEDEILFEKRIPAKKSDLLNALDQIRALVGDDAEIRAAYEAGVLGLVPYYWLDQAGCKCVVMAPTTMETSRVRKVKTDSRDAFHISHLLSHGGYKAIHIPDELDRQVRDYIRMRDQRKNALKAGKQHLQAFALKLGFSSTHKAFTGVWMEDLKEWSKGLGDIDRETLEEYLIELDQHEEALRRFDSRIEQLACLKQYEQKARELTCLIGISTYTAMVLISEIGDFNRFKSPEQLASYLGLTPGENSSGDKRRRTGITKNGNGHVRRVLTEVCQGVCRGQVGYKSKALKKRQEGQRPEVIEYADKGSRYLRKKYYRLISSGKNRNVAVTAVARSMVGFIWGIMTDHTELNPRT